jgi:gas vesicle protein
MSDKGSKNFLYGFIAGGIVGAALALLYAPSAGKELRKSIKGGTDRAINEIDEYFEYAKNSVGEVVNEAKKKSEDLVNQAKKQAKNLIQESEELLSKAKDIDIEEDIRNFPVSGIDAYKPDHF